MSETFNAYLLRAGADGAVTGAFEAVPVADLPDGDVTVRVAYTTVNYKDGMVMKGIGRLVRTYPHIPGVDFSGTVESSSNPSFAPGDPVVLTGWRVGEVRWGGYGALARVQGDWLVRLPEGLSLADAMALGTARHCRGQKHAAYQFRKSTHVSHLAVPETRFAGLCLLMGNARDDEAMM